MKQKNKEADNKSSKNQSGIKKFIKKAMKFIRKLLSKLMIPIVIIIIAAAWVVGIIEEAVEAVGEAIGSIGEFFQATVNENDGAIEVDTNQVDTIINSLYSSGLDPSDLGLLGDIDTEGGISDTEYQEALRKYIKEFYEAQVTTETLNYKHIDSTDDVTYGSVYVYRATSDKADENRQNLTYISYDDMVQYKDNNDINAKNYFSITDDGQLVIAETRQTIVETGSSKNNLSEESNNTVVSLRTIDYKSAISEYTTQMTFLIDLVMISKNPEFVSAVVDLIKDSRIEITVMDKITTNEVLEEYKYTPMRKWTDYKTVTGSTPAQTTVQKIVHNEKDGNDVTEVTKTTTISTNPTFNITRVKTWFSEQNIEYNKNTDGPTTTTTTEGPEDELEPTEDEGNYRTNITSTITTTTTTEEYKQGKRGDVTFTVGEKGDGKRYEDGQIPEPTFVGLMETGFQIPNTERKEEAGSNLVNGSDLLFHLLQKDQNLQNMETIMRYALYKYSGTSYGVTELDGSIFDIQEFIEVSQSTDLASYLRQFSHSSEAPKSSDGNYYLMYGDGAGWPTIGNADLQWKSNYPAFQLPGKVLENGQEKEVQDVAAYVNSKLVNGPTAKYSDNEIDAMQIFVEVELVDQIGSNVQDEHYDYVKNETSGLNLSKQQLYALVTIKYNFGNLPVRNGKTFVEVYQEGAKQYEINSWQHNMYIWDNWWAYLGGGYAGHIPARDAAFETYVKGTYDFNQSDAGTVFNRNYYIYYTQSQLNQYSYAPNKPITRTSANEQEIFEYVENSGGSIIEAADQLHQAQITWTYSVGGDLYSNDIESSINNPNQVTCCATYASSAIYRAGYFSEDQMNSFNYNSSNGLYNFLLDNGWQSINSYSELQAGDIVFMDTDGGSRDITHVQIYAGDGLWYNAGATEAIQRASPYSQGDLAEPRFMVALRPN